MKVIPGHTCRVIKKTQLTKNMLRIDFEISQSNSAIVFKPGCYVKLHLPVANRKKPKVRTYTLKNYDEVNKILTIDFALHQPAGIATNWAICAEIGETIEILGPGYLKIEPHIGDWYLFAADMAALPAAISVIESLSPDAKGFAFLEVTQEADKQKINLPENLEVTWLYHAKPKTKSGQQLKAIKELKIPEGQPNVFVAGELSTIREIKQFLIQNEKFSNAITYISSYWKTGLNEEGHKKEKQKSEIK